MKEDNRMTDFVKGADSESETPQLRNAMSFGEKDSRN